MFLCGAGFDDYVLFFRFSKLSLSVSVCLRVCLSVSVCLLSVCLCLSVRHVCLSACLPACPSVCLLCTFDVDPFFPACPLCVQDLFSLNGLLKGRNISETESSTFLKQFRPRLITIILNKRMNLISTVGLCISLKELTLFPDCQNLFVGSFSVIV